MRKKFYKKCSENSRSQIVFRTDIFRRVQHPQDWLGTPTRDTHREYSSKPLNHNIVERILAFKR